MAPVLHSKSLEDLIRKLLNAGYVDIYNLTDRTQYNTELVRGSIISPLCNNILLHQLDCYVEDELIRMFEDGALSPAGDEHRKKLKYLRYADNILIGLKGSKQDGLSIRQAVQTFLQQKLKFDINERTSTVSNARTEMTKFLGALIQYGWLSSIDEHQLYHISSIGAHYLYSRLSWCGGKAMNFYEILLQKVYFPLGFRIFASFSTSILFWWGFELNFLVCEVYTV